MFHMKQVDRYHWPFLEIQIWLQIRWTQEWGVRMFLRCLITGALSLMVGASAVQAEEYIYGFFPPRIQGSSVHHIPIYESDDAPGAGLTPDSRLKVTLDRFVVEDIPGWSTHNLLLVITAQDQLSIVEQSLDHGHIQRSIAALSGSSPESAEALSELKSISGVLKAVAAPASEPVSYAGMFPVKEGDPAGIKGFPIFTGLRSSSEGIALRITVVDVANQDYVELFSEASKALSKGVVLTGFATPASKIFMEYTNGLVQALVKRDRSKVIMNVGYGTDNTLIASRPKLREGSYIIAQVKNGQSYNWNDYRYGGGTIQKVNSSAPDFKANYMIISISKMPEASK